MKTLIKNLQEISDVYTEQLKSSSDLINNISKRLIFLNNPSIPDEDKTEIIKSSIEQMGELVLSNSSKILQQHQRAIDIYEIINELYEQIKAIENKIGIGQ